MTHSDSGNRAVMSNNRLIGLLAFSLAMTGAIGLASEAKEHVLERSKPLEEVVAIGVSACGSWPVRHSDIVTYEYAELSRETLPRIRELRTKLLDNCLNCATDICRPEIHPSHSILEARLCQRVFWTPRRVGKIAAPIEDTEPLQVDFAYAISRRGRVDDIVVLDFEGNWSKSGVLNLLRQAAADVRYEPLIIDGTRRRIEGLNGVYVLGL